MDQTKNISELEHANTRLSMNNDSILRAEVAQYVYRVDEYRRGHISNLPKPPVGLEVIDGDNIPSLKGSVFTDKKSGFGAALLKSEINGETMLVFRGTNNGVTGMEDWKTNGLQGIGRETAQYNQAMNLAKDVKYNIDDDFAIVGHSLGGGLASAAVGVTGISGYTYNAAGLHSNTVARKGGLPNDKLVDLITTQSVEGEILTMVQKHGDKALTAIGAGIGAMAYGQVGAVIGVAAAGMLADVPQAIGTMHSLPSVDDGSPIDKHGMDQVIAGIEAQKEEDLNSLSSYMDS